MKATIWHNPACGTSRKTLAILEETPGVAVTVIPVLNVDGVLAEEGSGYERASGWRWIVDPLDGTTNFIHGVGTLAIPNCRRKISRPFFHSSCVVGFRLSPTMLSVTR